MSEMTADEGRANAQAWLAGVARARESEKLVAPYVEAAAVLSTFSLKSINPVGLDDDDRRNEAVIELTNRCKQITELGLDAWQLEESARRTALRRLASRDSMKKARAANPAEASDPLQAGIDLLINLDAPNLDTLSLDELLGVERAVLWFEGILPGIPVRADLAARIERERRLAPMRKLAGDGFVDRESYLAQLRDYVGALPPGTVWRGFLRGIKYVAYWIDQRPPLHLHGPGGIGKSALLARFILEHADPKSSQPLPFVYLDFDRASLDPRDPQTLLEEAIRQLLIQFPWAAEEFHGLNAEAHEVLASADSQEVAKSDHFERRADLVRRFCRLLDVVATRNEQPVLLLLDTLEEAEYQGGSAMMVTWQLLEELLRSVDRLRVVTAGRSPLGKNLSREPVELTGLPESAGVELLIEHTKTLPGGPISTLDANEIVTLVGPVPLSLRLAARVVVEEGIEALRTTVGRRRLFRQIQTEQQQGMLYRRILGHVKEHNKELEKVANPGLILRRITPEIIEKVLAKPCRLDLKPPNDAMTLFQKLEKETGLVDPYREPGALWHLPAVRRIMLPGLRQTLGKTAQSIHQAAADYYRDRPSDIEHAERIYHLLWLEKIGDAEALWNSRLIPYLRGAFEELEPQAKIWLGNKLGIELDLKLRSQADLATWERQAEQRARTLLSSGLVTEALAALRERPRSGDPSPLYAIESDALKLLGRLDEARSTLDLGLEAAEKVGDRAAMLPLKLREVFLLETTGELDLAFSQAKSAMDLARELGDGPETLSAGVARLRIGRKLRIKAMTEETARSAGKLLEYRSSIASYEKLREEMLALLRDPELRAALKSRPALLREAAAELGTYDVSLLAEAVSVLGLTSDDHVALIRYTQESALPLNENQQRLLKELEGAGTSRGMGSRVAELVPAFTGFFADRMTQSVEDALSRTVSPQASPSWFSTSGLTHAQKRSLVDLIVRDFTPHEVEILAFDSFDRYLNEVAAPNVPFRVQVHNLLEYGSKLPDALHKFLNYLARSRPSNPELNRIIADFRATD